MTTKEKFTAEVTLPSDTEVRVTRSFHAPRTLVWQAHTVPELARRWLGYPGWSMPVCEMDVRPGGKFRWRWRSDENGQELGFFGTFNEVDEPATYSYDEYYDPGDFGGAMPSDTPARIRTSFTEENGVTTLVQLMDYGSKEARDAAVSTGMSDGMEVSYQRLDALFASEQGA
jgi:uncharacterized protein YndB with AHSA1/START domain